LTTCNSSYWTPFCSQIGASSSSLMGRDASEMSVSPAQNFSKPPPVPDWPTVIFTSGCSLWKPSAAAWANGKTVLEPSMAMVPDSSCDELASCVSAVAPDAAVALPPPSSSSPQAAAPNASAPAHATARILRCLTGFLS
jgi:hypothetical protein